MCALQLNDPWVSEANALVSLRGGGLTLLRLRGHLGQPPDTRESVDEILLHGGEQQVVLGRDTTLVVEEVNLPGDLFALESPSLGRRRHALEPPHAAVVHRDGKHRLVAGHPDDAVVVLACTDGRWSARAVSERVAYPLPRGRGVRIGELTLTLWPYRRAEGTTLVAPPRFRIAFTGLDKVEVERDGEVHALAGRGWAYFHHFVVHAPDWDHWLTAVETTYEALGVRKAPTKSGFHKARTAMLRQLAAVGIHRELFEKSPAGDGQYRFKPRPGEYIQLWDG